MSYRFVDSFRAGPGWNRSSILVLLENCAPSWFYYREICYDARSHERKMFLHPFSRKLGKQWRLQERCVKTGVKVRF